MTALTKIDDMYRQLQVNTASFNYTDPASIILLISVMGIAAIILVIELYPWIENWLQAKRIAKHVSTYVELDYTDHQLISKYKTKGMDIKPLAKPTVIKDLVPLSTQVCLNGCLIFKEYMHSLSYNVETSFADGGHLHEIDSFHELHKDNPCRFTVVINHDHPDRMMSVTGKTIFGRFTAWIRYYPDSNSFGFFPEYHRTQKTKYKDRIFKHYFLGKIIGEKTIGGTWFTWDNLEDPPLDNLSGDFMLIATDRNSNIMI